MHQGVAFLAMRDRERLGLLGQAETLNRVAPLLFRPRLNRVFFVPEADVTGFLISLPIGTGNWQSLNEETRIRLLQQADRLCAGFGAEEVILPGGIRQDRLDGILPGDRFTAVMVALKLAQRLERTNCRRVVVVAERGVGFLTAALIAERFRLPVVLQCRAPATKEASAMRLLYEAGIPIAISGVNRDQWGPEDVVIVLDDLEEEPNQGLLFYLDACPNSAGHAPLLESRLASQRVPPRLSLLAPLLEARLATGADPAKEREIVHAIEENGSPIWYYFLDKGPRSHYNSIKG